MKNLRIYGNPPYRVAVIHGGPGAPGEMAPVSEELSKSFGVLEPLQTKDSLDGQIEELKQVIKENGAIPIMLVGWSWGAWLSFLFTAKYQAYVKKLILIGSGPFDEKYASQIMETRLGRLSKADRQKVSSFAEIITNAKDEKKNDIFRQFGVLLSKADALDPLPVQNDIIEYQYSIYEGVWRNAKKLRSTGKLLEYGRNITCPVVAIHGDYDPHPAKGVKEPLSKVVKDFRFILLEKCGHKPWYEKEARDRFFKLLRKELE